VETSIWCKKNQSPRDSLNIGFTVITSGLYTPEHHIVVAADSGGTLKRAYEENICYT
jgi:hypothetical protein